MLDDEDLLHLQQIIEERLKLKTYVDEPNRKQEKTEIEDFQNDFEENLHLSATPKKRNSRIEIEEPNTTEIQMEKQNDWTSVSPTRSEDNGKHFCISKKFEI